MYRLHMYICSCPLSVDLKSFLKKIHCEIACSIQVLESEWRNVGYEVTSENRD